MQTSTHQSSIFVYRSIEKNDYWNSLSIEIAGLPPDEKLQLVNPFYRHSDDLDSKTRVDEDVTQKEEPVEDVVKSEEKAETKDIKTDAPGPPPQSVVTLPIQSRKVVCRYN